MHVHKHTAELQSKVAEGVEKFSCCAHRGIMRRESVWGEDGLVDSDDESFAISCSSPCLSTAVIASGCWEIIAFLSAFPNSPFLSPSFPSITHLQSSLFVVFYFSPFDDIAQLGSLFSQSESKDWTFRWKCARLFSIPSLCL